MSKGGGSAPQPTDPYAQAGAQYGLSTGTAAFNAALNRPNVSNPLGSTNWNVTGYSGGIPSSAYGGGGGIPSYGGGFGRGGGYGGAFGFGGGGVPAPYRGGSAGGSFGLGAGAPIYTQSTQLAPQFQAPLERPIDTSQVPGMPGGPSLEQNVAGSQEAAFQREMGLLAPIENQQIESTKADLAAQGATPGSAAYDWGMKGLGLTLGPENAQVANNAYLTGINTLPTLYGLGSTSLENQIAARNAPIQEFQALQPGGGAAASAMTPDISNAFAQQYQGRLAGYNAQQAANNATWGDISSLGSAALLAFMLA